MSKKIVSTGGEGKHRVRGYLRIAGKCWERGKQLKRGRPILSPIEKVTFEKQSERGSIWKENIPGRGNCPVQRPQTRSMAVIPVYAFLCYRNTSEVSMAAAEWGGKASRRGREKRDEGGLTGYYHYEDEMRAEDAPPSLPQQKPGPKMIIHVKAQRH